MTHLDLFGIPASPVGWAGVWGCVGYMLSHWIKTRPRMRELEATADGSLRADLLRRIRELEERIDAKDRECNERIEKLEQLWLGKGGVSTLGKAVEHDE